MDSESSVPTFAELMTAAIKALSSNGLVVQSCRARMIRPSRWRPVLRCAVTYLDSAKNASVRKVLIGKGYNRGDGARTFHSMMQLWSDGFADDRFLAIPEPVAYLPELNLLLQGRAPGKALYLYLDDPQGGLDAVRQAGRWLAKLHSSTKADAPVLRPEQEREKLSTYRTALMQVCPAFASRIESLTDRILSAAVTAASGDIVPTHGDFQPKNIYVLRNQVTVIDFDRFALAHPARDLGHFIGQSMTMSFVRTGSFTEVQPWNSAFLQGYASHGSQEALSAVPASIARTFLEILYYKLFVRPVKDPHFLPVWLDECERWLEAAHLRGGLPW